MLANRKQTYFSVLSLEQLQTWVHEEELLQMEYGITRLDHLEKLQNHLREKEKERQQ